MTKRKKACTRAHTSTHTSFHAHTQTLPKPEPLCCPHWTQAPKDGVGLTLWARHWWPAHWQLLLGEEEQRLCGGGDALGTAQPSNQWEEAE